MTEQLLNVNGLKVNVEDREILHGIDLQMNAGETHVLMSFIKKIANARPATEKPIFPMRLASFVSWIFNGVGSVLCSVLWRA